MEIILDLKKKPEVQAAKIVEMPTRASRNALFVEIQFAPYIFPLLTPILVTTKNFRLLL